MKTKSFQFSLSVEKATLEKEEFCDAEYYQTNYEDKSWRDGFRNCL